MRGSSPLARGLQQERPHRHRHRRIIPARAGFTPAGGARRRPTADHPRSRGVYSGGGRMIEAPTGSSPLARGLRRSTPSSPTPALDHPRSRGVYAPDRHAGSPSLGSSPLARGLLRVTLLGTACHRIIPARAGFTGGTSVPGGVDWDHPRSRGVYPSSRPSPPCGTGSSPLARGLRGCRHPGPGGRGIIPARAGFTAISPSTSLPIWDHPRSRGVYSSGGLMGGLPNGSSPLARGLRQDFVIGIIRKRIIPARAGFTPSPGSHIRGRSDHPRSRGVYGC